MKRFSADSAPRSALSASKADYNGTPATPVQHDSNGSDITVERTALWAGDISKAFISLSFGFCKGVLS
jgi:hypothetical protein